MIREIHQLEAKIAFWSAVLAQWIALLTPVKDEPGVLWQLLEEARKLFSSEPEFVAIAGSLFLGPNLLFLASPFLTRVYGQSKAVLWLAILMSFAITAAVGVLFIAAEPRDIRHYAFLVAAAAHTIGLFRVRQEGPEDDPLH